MNMPAQISDNTKPARIFRTSPVTGVTKEQAMILLATATYSTDYVNNSIRDNFLKLAEQWRDETGHISNMLYKYMNKNYQQIISKGNDVVPMILEELRSRPSHWFWALEMITNENPVKQDHIGYIDLMARDWIEWGKSKGYLLT